MTRYLKVVQASCRRSATGLKDGYRFFLCSRGEGYEKSETLQETRLNSVDFVSPSVLPEKKNSGV